jgi:hypothetical protein
LHIIEPRNVEPDTANPREEAGEGFGIGGRGDQRTMHGHRLRGKFYPAGNAKPAMRAQRMIRCAVTAAAAANLIRTPIDDFIEQAHAAVMRNVGFNPGAIQLHRST